MIHQVIKSHEPSLKSQLSHILSDLHDDAYRQKLPPQEPDFIAHMSVGIPPRLGNLLNYELSHYKLKFHIASVFCHQSPMVKYGTPSISCELGDLLICFFYHKKDGTINRRSILFQAKISATKSKKIEPNELVQLQLYKEWPEFEYVKGSLHSLVRSVYPKQTNNGGQYLLIEPRGMHYPYFFKKSPFTVSIPNEVLYPYGQLEKVILNLIGLQAGNPFDGKRSIKDDWTQITWDLLNNGLKRGFNRLRSGFLNTPRLTPDGDVASWNAMMSFSTSLEDLPAGSILRSDDLNYKDALSAVQSSKGNEPPTGKYIDNDEESSPSIILIEAFDTGN